MGLFLAVLAAQGVLSSTEITVARSHRTILTHIEFQQTDVREAIKKLFREGRFAGTIAPEVQGVVTLSLRNVDFDTALQNVVRQVDATYRVDHGFFEIVRRSDADVPVSTPTPEPDATIGRISAAYGQMAATVKLGLGKTFVEMLDPSFEFRNATQTKKAGPAIRWAIDTQRSFPRFAIERGPIQSKGTYEVIVSYGRADEPLHYFRDSWREDKGRSQWILCSREETALPAVRKFVRVPLSKILASLFAEFGGSCTLDPSLDHEVTIDLTGVPIEQSLTRLIRPIGATYRIEGGVYHVVRL